MLSAGTGSAGKENPPPLPEESPLIAGSANDGSFGIEGRAGGLGKEGAGSERESEGSAGSASPPPGAPPERAGASIVGSFGTDGSFGSEGSEGIGMLSAGIDCLYSWVKTGFPSLLA